MLEKRTFVDQIEITRTGVVQVRLSLVVADGAEELVHQWHRTAVVPGGDIDAQMSLVDAHLAQMGYPSVPAVDIDRVKAQAAAAWTPVVLADYQISMGMLA